MTEPRDGEARPALDSEEQLLHDLRQPLAAIMAAASAVRANSSVDDATREKLLAIILTNAERLSDMLSSAFGKE
ncbi:MAG: hypothetical protein E6G68_00085 [Actinobacteria bacterium]|nr:MAG: hypothetical protein E6G68_00085 [Actinomycetota bacterium]